MEYYFTEMLESAHAVANSKNAGSKARRDVAAILSQSGAVPCEVYVDITARSEARGLQKLVWHRRAIQVLERSLAQLRPGDTLYIQFQMICHSIFVGHLFRRLKRKGIRVVLIVHDLEILRKIKLRQSLAAKARIRAEELQALYSCSGIVVHNEAMKAALEALGIEKSKMANLGLFDYLLPGDEMPDPSRFRRDGDVVVAGNLAPEKCAYLYALPADVHWSLYGAGYDDKACPQITWHGTFTPEELPFRLEGSFGLVWDGTSAETCAGIYGEYLRINNPHKTSLYLAAGMPVIIWNKAALASFVEEERIGLTVSSLGEIREAIDSLTEEEYSIMKENAGRIGNRLRNGQYLPAALDQLRHRQSL